MSNVLQNILLIVQILSALVMIGLILVQHGKGADMGAAFGGGGNSGSLFGASGSANFMSRATAVLATVFFAATLLLAMLSNYRPAGSDSVLDRAPLTAPATAPLPGASGAAQIPGTSGPTAPAASTAAPAAAPAASGAAQIPTK